MICMEMLCGYDDAIQTEKKYPTVLLYFFTNSVVIIATVPWWINRLQDIKYLKSISLNKLRSEYKIKIINRTANGTDDTKILNQFRFVNCFDKFFFFLWCLCLHLYQIRFAAFNYSVHPNACLRPIDLNIFTAFIHGSNHRESYFSAQYKKFII